VNLPSGPFGGAIAIVTLGSYVCFGALFESATAAFHVTNRRNLSGHQKAAFASVASS